MFNHDRAHVDSMWTELEAKEQAMVDMEKSLDDQLKAKVTSIKTYLD